MVKIDLITGFLGSGKTTFIRKYAKFLMDRGENICILENDYGAVNVDMMLLQELEGEQCELEMVAGGCDYDCHKRRFKTKLISMGMCGYDRVLVEPSGIFDVDEFFDVLCEEPLNRWYQIGNVIAIVDANLPKEMSEEAEYLLASETAEAGCVVLSRSQNVDEKQIEQVKKHLNRSMDRVNCRRQFDGEVISIPWDTFQDTHFERIRNSGYRSENFVKYPIHEENHFSSLYFMNLNMSKELVLEKAGSLFDDDIWGHVIRVKGFVKNEGRWFEINAAADGVRIEPIEKGQDVLIIIGENLNEPRIREYWNAE